MPTHCYDSSYELPSQNPYVILNYECTRSIGTHKTLNLRQVQFDEVSNHVYFNEFWCVTIWNRRPHWWESGSDTDVRLKRITFKRPVATPAAECCSNNTALETDHNILYTHIPGFLEIICEKNRLDDLISLLRAICYGPDQFHVRSNQVERGVDLNNLIPRL